MNETIIPDFNLQPVTLKNEFVKLFPLKITDFDRLYKVASDPLIWEQHPTNDRYKKEVFELFFTSGIESGGAFIVCDTKTDEPIGCSRFYQYEKNKKTIAIGFTFLARAYWGTPYNRALKSLMLDYAFGYVDSVIFHIGTGNMRSQKAIEKLGAKKNEEMEIKLYDKQEVMNYVYQIDKEAWKELKQQI